MNRVSDPVSPPSRLTASKYSSNLARSQPPSSHSHGLQVHISKLAWSWPPSASPNSLDYGLWGYPKSRLITASKFAWSQPPSGLQTRSITASNCIYTLARLRPPSSHDHGLQVHLQTRSNTAYKCISKLARSQPPSVSPNLHDYGLQVRTIKASECISKFTRTRCGEMVELESRQPIINTPPHLALHPMRVPKKEAFRLEECRKRVRGYEGILGHVEQHKLLGSLKARQGCVRPRSVKGRVCISYNVMLSIYPGVCQIYTRCRWVHPRYRCISICIYIDRLRWYMPYHDVANVVTVTKTNMINEMPCGWGTLRTTAV